MRGLLAKRAQRWRVVSIVAAVMLGLGLVGLAQSWAGATKSSGERPVLVPIEPCRLTDTRPGGTIGPHGTLQPGATITIAAHGSNGQCFVPGDATALSTNVTAIGATAVTYLTIWGDGPMPNASSLNPAPGQPPTPNAVTTPLSGAGGFNVFNYGGFVDIIVDVNGYYVHHDHHDLYTGGSGGGGGPGVASGGTLANSELALTSNYQEVFTLQMNVPQDGYAVVNASGFVALDGTGYDQAFCRIFVNGTYSGFDINMSDNDDPGRLIVPFSQTLGTGLLTAGVANFELRCREALGTVTVHDVLMSAIYLPENYTAP